MNPLDVLWPVAQAYLVLAAAKGTWTPWRAA